MTSHGHMETYLYQEAKDNLPLNVLQYQSVCQATEEWIKKLQIKKVTEKLENPIRPF